MKNNVRKLSKKFQNINNDLVNFILKFTIADTRG